MEQATCDPFSLESSASRSGLSRCPGTDRLRRPCRQRCCARRVKLSAAARPRSTGPPAQGAKRVACDPLRLGRRALAEPPTGHRHRPLRTVLRGVVDPVGYTSADIVAGVTSDRLEQVRRALRLLPQLGNVATPDAAGARALDSAPPHVRIGISDPYLEKPEPKAEIRRHVLAEPHPCGLAHGEALVLRERTEERQTLC